MASRASPVAPWIPLGLVAVAWGGLVLAAAVLAPSLSVPGLAAYLVAFAAVSVSTLTAGAVAPTAGPVGTTLVLAVGLAALAAAALMGAHQGDPIAAGMVTSGLLLVGSALGAAVGGRIEHPGHLLPVAVVSLLVDSFSVLHVAGPAAAIAGRPTIIALVALSWPVPGTHEVAPVLGVGDVIFAGLYLAASRRHGLGRLRTALALGVGLLVTALAVIATTRAFPALPAMGAAVLVAHPLARRLPVKDRRVGWIGIAVVGALWLASWLYR